MGEKQDKNTKQPAVETDPRPVKVLAMIKKAGKDGIGGAEIRKSFPGVGQNIKEFVEKNAGVKVKTTGQKIKMRYHAV